MTTKPALIGFTLISITLLLCSCAQTAIIPLGNSKYTVDASGTSKIAALDNARKQAMKACAQRNKTYKVLNYKVTARNNTTSAAKKNASITQNILSAVDIENTSVHMTFQCLEKYHHKTKSNKHSLLSSIF
jgi:hypothetical protein